MVPVLIVFILFVVLPAVILNGVKEIRKTQGSKQGGGELRASELRAMIRDSVEEALEPLSARVADLEERLGDESVEELRARLDPAVLAAALESDLDAEDEVPAVARRARS